MIEMKFSRDSVRVAWGRLFYQIDKSNGWKLLESPYATEKKQGARENVRKMIFSHKGISVSQFDSPPMQANTTLLRDSLRWTITFAARQISNIRAKEYLNDGEEREIDVIFDYNGPLTGFESTQKRHPRASKTPANGPR